MCDCPADAEEATGPEQLQIGLLVSVVVVTVAIAAAVLLSLYVYVHPTSSVSLFFIEVRFKVSLLLLIKQKLNVYPSMPVYFCLTSIQSRGQEVIPLNICEADGVTQSICFLQRRPTHWPILKFRRGSGRPSYAEVEISGQDKDSAVVIDPKQSFVISDRRESELKEGFIVPDQRERFLLSENS